MKVLLGYLIFPGFLFTVIIGGLGWWLERKITARFQYRIGPPWYQNFFDILKLFIKETLIPKDAQRVLFIVSPILSFTSALLASFIVNEISFWQRGFIGDVIVILYLLIIPSIFLILGGLASSNPLATAGATREVKLLLAYEFVFIASLLIAIVKAGGALSLEKIITYQEATGSSIKSVSGVIGFVLALFYLQAKLGIPPFDISEAEQEIMGGPLIEYSGPLLGFFKLSKALLFFLYLYSLLLFSGGSY